MFQSISRYEVATTEYGVQYHANSSYINFNIIPHRKNYSIISLNI